jgi:aminopeptidase N
VKPDWRLEEVFVIEVHQVALEYDQKPTHAISGSVNTPDEIRGMFDDISYSKAGAVLRMLQYTVTEKNFEEALNFYLKANR